jgi:Siphovirus ReqiPepy6 Gp37-like protein
VVLFTVDRSFARQQTLDKFNSVIWTERYYGDSEVELVVPNTAPFPQILTPGIFVALEGSRELMILETANFDKENNLKVTGISLLKWLNNRIIRTSAKHEDRYWNVTQAPGYTLQTMVYYMCVGGTYIDGTTPNGIPNMAAMKVPGLYTYEWDKSGAVVNTGIPFGPLFDALYEIATTYELGQQILLNTNNNPAEVNRLQYRNYKGIDRTSAQTTYPVVRFSSDMDSLTDVEELQSIANYKTVVYAFAPGLDEASRPLATTPGVQSRVTTAGTGSGFDLRAQMVFAEDITTDQVGGDAAKLLDILNSRAKDGLANSEYVQVVDGEIVPTAQFKYGRDYGMGDLIEIQGKSGAISRARVTEYIRSQDSSGEKSYPTVTVKP